MKKKNALSRNRRTSVARERRPTGRTTIERDRIMAGRGLLSHGSKSVQGFAAAVVLVESAEDVWDPAEMRSEWPTKTKRKKGGKKGGGKASVPRLNKRICGVMAAAGHEVRAKLMLKLLQGPATYQALKRTSKLEAGPLYHHINQLRLAGLILPKQRDLYELTRGGRNLILAMAVLGPLVNDRRRRPLIDGGK